MRYSLAVFVVILLTLCGCKTQQSSLQQQIEIRDSLRIRDSIRIQDSVAIKLDIRDSLRIKDSTVITKDTNGNILSQEHWHEKEHISITKDSSAYYKNVAEQTAEELVRVNKLLKEKQQVIIQKPSLMERMVNGLFFFLLGAIVGAVVLHNLDKKFRKSS